VRLADRAPRLVAACQVGLYSETSASQALDFGWHAVSVQRLAEFARRVEIDVDDRDVGPSAPQSARRAGHHRDLAREPVVIRRGAHNSSSWFTR
jgi:hypothetical protein